MLRQLLLGQLELQSDAGPGSKLSSSLQQQKAHSFLMPYDHASGKGKSLLDAFDFMQAWMLSLLLPHYLMHTGRRRQLCP